MFEFLKKFKVRTYFGFPIATDGKEPIDSARKRGVALLIAMMTIMLMVGLVADMIVSSSVSIKMVAATRDRVRAEYNAKSGFNLALFLLGLSWAYDLTRAQKDVPQAVRKDLSDDGKSLWNMINKLPPIGSLTLELVKAAKTDEDDPFKLRSVLNEKIGETMKLFESNFSVKILDEGSKINVNQCFAGRCDVLIDMLKPVFECPAEKAFLEAKNVKPEQLVYRIKDFISNSTVTSEESGFSDKNQPYEDQTPPYSVKGLPFDTVDELKLIAGWDDEIHKVFEPYLTVYPYPTAADNNGWKMPVNINTVKPELLSCMVPDARAPSCAESFAIKMNKIKKDNSVVFSNTIKETLSSLACYTSQAASTGSQPKKGPEDWFDSKSSVFRIEVSASTGDQDRKIISVVRRVMPQEKANNRDQQNMKRSYQILHWKLL